MSRNAAFYVIMVRPIYWIIETNEVSEEKTLELAREYLELKKNSKKLPENALGKEPLGMPNY